MMCISRPLRLVGAVVLCAGIASGGFVPRADAQEEPTVPDVVAAGVVNMPATKHPLGDLEGRLVLLTFFAPWSERCATAVPHLNKTENRWAGRGLTVLSVAEGALDAIEAWTEENAVEFACAALPTPEYEKLSTALSVPGLPHAVLLSPDAKVLWSGHPQALKDAGIRPHMKGIRTPPLHFPVALAAQERLFADGKWSAARQALVDVRESLDKVTKRWADGLIEFVDARRASWLTDAEALAEAGRYWDAWEMFADFASRFEGMDGGEGAAAQATAIRADAAAARDLAAGDDIVKVKGLIEKGRTRPAQLILRRVLKQAKGSVHAKRAQRLLDSL